MGRGSPRSFCCLKQHVLSEKEKNGETALDNTHYFNIAKYSIIPSVFYM